MDSDGDLRCGLHNRKWCEECGRVEWLRLRDEKKLATVYDALQETAVDIAEQAQRAQIRLLEPWRANRKIGGVGKVRKARMP